MWSGVWRPASRMCYFATAWSRGSNGRIYLGEHSSRLQHYPQRRLLLHLSGPVVWAKMSIYEYLTVDLNVVHSLSTSNLSLRNESITIKHYQFSVKLLPRISLLLNEKLRFQFVTSTSLFLSYPCSSFFLRSSSLDSVIGSEIGLDGLPDRWLLSPFRFPSICKCPSTFPVLSVLLL